MFGILIHQDKDFKKELKRKAIHLSSLWIPVFIYFAPKTWSIVLFATFLTCNIILEYGNYKKWSWARLLFGKLFTATLRTKEIKKDKFRPSGAVYMLTAVLLSTIIFQPVIASLSLTIMLVSDTFAALVGKAYGKHKIHGKKSIEGTFAFFATALLVMILYNPLYTLTYASIIACIVATLVELYEDKIHIDDNLSISMSIGLILTLLG